MPAIAQASAGMTWLLVLLSPTIYNHFYISNYKKALNFCS
jgi:hypothetical protein